MMKLIYTIFLIFSFSLLFQSCSPDVARDDAVRIKKEHWKDYENVPGTNEIRNSATLRGEVVRIEKVNYMCDDSITGKKVYVVFRDKTPDSHLEYIPIDDVDLVGTKPEVNLDSNWFEKFNDPLNPREMREVPVTVRPLDTCEAICDCGPVDMSCPNIPCRPDKIKDTWYFMEFRGAYAAYSDKLPNLLTEDPMEAYAGEIAAGFRFGNRHQWGLGLSFFTGVPIYNSQNEDFQIIDGVLEEATRRPAVLLHARYSFDKTWCLFPFLYGQLGVAIDDLSLDFWSFDLGCKDCKRKLEVNDDFNADGEIALSYGFGAGIDFPLSCNFDFSFDVGFKSLAIGEKSTFPVNGILVPDIRRVNMFILRLGITI